LPRRAPSERGAALDPIREQGMASLTQSIDPHLENPLDLIEQVVAANDWPFERHEDGGLTVEVSGRWCAYQLLFAWRAEVTALLFSCAFDMKVPALKRLAICHLVNLINERLWFGHFEVWSEEGMPVFRQATLLRESPGLSASQIQDMVDLALNEAERFYPAFQHVVWGGKSPEEAIELALVDTLGEA